MEQGKPKKNNRVSGKSMGEYCFHKPAGPATAATLLSSLSLRSAGNLSAVSPADYSTKLSYQSDVMPLLTHRLHNRYLLVIYILLAFVSPGEKLSAQISVDNPASREEAMRAVRLRDYVKAKELFDILAQAGDVDAEYQLGVLYQTGKGVARDYKKALSLFKHSAEKAHIKAQYALGAMYENGWGVEPDYKEALIWYKKSSDAGYAQALIKVKSITADGSFIGHSPNISKNESLLAEARLGRVKIIAQLLNKGADINFQDNFGRSALMEAIDNGHSEAARFLIQKSANPEILNNDGDNALLIATEKKNIDIVRALLEAGSDINIANKNGLTPLTVAVKNNDVSLVRLFIDNKGIKKADLANKGALQMALGRGYKEVAGILMSIDKSVVPSNEKDPAVLKAIIANLETIKDADKGMAFEKGNTLMLSAWRGEADVVKMLIAEGKDVNAKSKSGQTALSLAASRGHVDIVNMLLKAGAIPELSANEDVSSLILAARNGHEDVVTSLVRVYAISEDFRKLLNKALDIAIKNGHGAAAKVLLEKGATLNINEQQATSSLLSAASQGDSSLIEILLGYGARIDAADKSGRTTLMIAIEAGNQRIVKTLLERHSDFNKKDKEDHTALSLAASRGEKDIVPLLINAGSDIEAKSIYGNTPLMLAVYAGSGDIVEQLIRHKAKVDIANKAGDTALAIAVRKNDVHLAKILLDNGANPYLPLKLVNNSSKEISRLLNRYKSIKKLTSILITWRFKKFELINPGQGLGYVFGIIGVSLMVILFIYSFRKRISGLEVIGSIKAWFRIHMALGILGPLLILFHANFHLGSFNSNVALFSMLIVSASGIIGRYIYSRIHYGLYGELANLIELKNKLEQQKEEVSLEFALIPGAKEELFSFSNDVLTPSTSLIKSVKKFLTIRWNAQSSFCKIQRVSAGYVNQAREIERKTRIFLDQTIKVVEFNFYERLFSFWHMLHIPLVFILLFAAGMHVIAVNRY